MGDADGLCAPDYRLGVVRTGAYRAVAGSWTLPALLACSGGTDSMALVMLAREALRSGSVGPFVVCHVDHRSRAESADEADMVRAMCADLGAPFVATRTGVGSPSPGRSTEASWREGRYIALASACRRLGISNLVTAHTRNDQVENILMRLLSGSSRLTIPSDRSLSTGGDAVQVIRPLLGIHRSELQSILDVAGRRPVDDPSNQDTAYRRNAVRNELIPAINDIYPGFDTALVRFAEMREDDAEFCDQVASDIYSSAATLEDQQVAIPRTVLAGSHRVIASRLVLLAARWVIGDTDNRELTRERVQSVLQAAAGRRGALIELPYGVRVSVERDEIVFSRAPEGT